MTSLTHETFIPDDKGSFCATIAGFDCEIGPGKRGDTWTVSVAGKRIVTETDDFDHAQRQAERFANSLKSAISVHRG